MHKKEGNQEIKYRYIFFIPPLYAQAYMNKVLFQIELNKPHWVNL